MYLAPCCKMVPTRLSCWRLSPHQALHAVRLPPSLSERLLLCDPVRHGLQLLPAVCNALGAHVSLLPNNIAAPVVWNTMRC